MWSRCPDLQTADQCSKTIGNGELHCMSVSSFQTCQLPALRRLLHQEVEWHWEEQQQASFKEIKKAPYLSPVLVFCDAKKELILQVDACSMGLGAALIQEGQPVAYASKVLSATQQNYAQI